MQAIRTCCVMANSTGSTDTTLFTVRTTLKPSDEVPGESTTNSDTTKTKSETTPVDPKTPGISTGSVGTKEETKPKNTNPENTMPKDPMRMFGILVPQALRLAQGEAVKFVEKLVPRIVSVDMELKNVEIEIRRKRKYKAKAEALEMMDISETFEKVATVECES
jgi:hypothetical protein